MNATASEIAPQGRAFHPQDPFSFVDLKHNDRVELAGGTIEHFTIHTLLGGYFEGRPRNAGGTYVRYETGFTPAEYLAEQAQLARANYREHEEVYLIPRTVCIDGRPLAEKLAEELARDAGAENHVLAWGDVFRIEGRFYRLAKAANHNAKAVSLSEEEAAGGTNG